MKRLLVAVLLSVPLSAQSPALAPEDWDLERRLAERFDEARNAERVAALVAKNPDLAFKPERYAPGSRYFVIDGERNPELYLPYELFESLLAGVLSSQSADDFSRGEFGRILGGFGWDAASFRTSIHELATGYREVRTRTKTAAERVAGCRLVYDRLEQARQKFGKKEFDAFLYRAIAPLAVDAAATTETDPAARLRHESRGCRPDPDPPGRQAWEWTLEQRVAARLVTADRKKRVERFVAAPDMQPKSPQPYDYIEGGLQPELLLPTEIVDVFIDVALASDRANAPAIRADAENRAIEDLDLPSDFFPALEKALAPAVAAHHEHARFMRTLKPGQAVGPDVAARVQNLQRDRCRARWKGIQTLRAAYGTAFDRFLYEAVAPKVRRPVYETMTGERLREVGKGCQ